MKRTCDLWPSMTGSTETRCSLVEATHTHRRRRSTRIWLYPRAGAFIGTTYQARLISPPPA